SANACVMTSLPLSWSDTPATGAALHQTCQRESWCRACADKRLGRTFAIRPVTGARLNAPEARASSWPRPLQAAARGRAPAFVVLLRSQPGETGPDIGAESSSSLWL